MFKPSGFYIAKEELLAITESDYPSVIARDLLLKYNFPADAGIDKETGEVFYEKE